MTVITTMVKWDKGDILYLVTDKEQLPRMVYGYEIAGNDVMYKVCSGTLISTHYDFELSVEKNVSLATTG